nr:hypothetical protein [Candidatus Dojkabacteria bacterium]
ILSTDFQGRTEGQFVLSTIYYNFILKYEDEVYFGIPNDNTNKKLIYAEDVTSGLTFTIDILEGGLLGSHQNTYDIVTNLTYIPLTNTTGYFRYYFNDPDNNQWPVCLEVTQGGSRDVVCSCESNQITSESGIITCAVSQPTGRELFTAKAIFEGGSVVDQFMTYVGQDTNIDWGITGYVIALFLVVVSAFIFIKMPSWSVLIATATFVACGMFGLIFKNSLGLMDVGVYIILLIIAFLIAKIKSDSSGLEGS